MGITRAVGVIILAIMEMVEAAIGDDEDRGRESTDDDGGGSGAAGDTDHDASTSRNNSQLRTLVPTLHSVTTLLFVSPYHFWPRS
eukprot:gene9004-biopygen7336